jgi:hypothetical protein
MLSVRVAFETSSLRTNIKALRADLRARGAMVPIARLKDRLRSGRVALLLCRSDGQVRHLPDLPIGSRFRVKSRGKFSRSLEGRIGTVLGRAHTKSTVCVLLDGQKRPQTLHRGYLQMIVDPVP